MKDKRYEILADNLINFSVGLKPGENVLIEALSGQEAALVTELVKAAYAAGAAAEETSGAHVIPQQDFFFLSRLIIKQAARAELSGNGY